MTDLRPALTAYLEQHVDPGVTRGVLDGVLDQPGAADTEALFERARTLALDALRSTSTPVVALAEVRGLVGTPGREAARRYAEAAPLLAAVQWLPDPVREVVVLIRVEGLSVPEVARRIDAPVGVVAARTSEGIRLLREELAGPPPQGVVA